MSQLGLLDGVAEYSDACVVFLNAWGGEGADRTESTNANQDELVNTVAGSCNNTIVVNRKNRAAPGRCVGGV